VRSIARSASGPLRARRAASASTAEHQLEAARERVAVDGGEQGLVEGEVLQQRGLHHVGVGQHAVIERVGGLARAGPERQQQLGVAARSEGLVAGAGEDAQPQRVVVAQGAQHVRESADCLGVG
jgi:hypothetical protein